MSSRRKKPQNKRERQIRIRDVPRNPPDLKKLAGALIALAQAQAEADAAAEHAEQQAVDDPGHDDTDQDSPTGDAA